MSTLFSLFIFLCTPLLYAADTHGYIAFWQHPEQTEVVTVTKTTSENASAEEAKAELECILPSARPFVECEYANSKRLPERDRIE